MITLNSYNSILLGFAAFFRNFSSQITMAVIFPIITLIGLFIFFFYYMKATQPLAGTHEWIMRELDKPRFVFHTTRYPMEKNDIIPFASIIIVFTFLALFRLGDTSAPQSFFQFTQERNRVVIELDSHEEISAVMYYTGLLDRGFARADYTLEFSSDGVFWHKQMSRPESRAGQSQTPTAPAVTQQHGYLFNWRYTRVVSDNYNANIGTDNANTDSDDDDSNIALLTKYIRLTAPRTPLDIGELAFYDAQGAIIPHSRIMSSDAAELFDEQHLVPERPTYMNSTYFDEIYHARTAYEKLNNIIPSETTHPPLGKEIIAASISVFGMTPFGWRFIGAVFGVIMLAVMYIFIKNLFGKTIIATCATLLFGFDFMRFVQTRIATIDTYGVFFILLSFFFMYRYITTSPDAPFRKSLTPLALSGLAFGLGFASKWIVAYAGLGLAVIYILRLIQYARHHKKDDNDGYVSYLLKTFLVFALFIIVISMNFIMGLALAAFYAIRIIRLARQYKRTNYLAKTLFFSFIFFVMVPAIIYYLSYIPYGLARGMTIENGMLLDHAFYNNIVWDNQVSMLSYHGNLVDTHPYSSQWWQWIINARPILYVRYSVDNLRSSFAAFGNPVVWWGGFIAVIFTAVDMIKNRDGKLLFIVIGYLAQILPWVIITRIVFVYHYFPSTLFLVLALAYVFDVLLNRAKNRGKVAIYGFTGAACAVFVMFYPALTGIYVPHQYFTNFLRWIPSMWPF